MFAALAALAGTIASQVEIWFLWAPDPDEPELALGFGARLAAAVAVGAFTLAFAALRRLPWLPLALSIPAIALTPAGPFDGFLSVAVALVAAAFTATALARTRGQLELAGALAAGTLVAIALFRPDSIAEPGDLLVLVAGVGGPIAAGAALWFRRDRERELGAQARQLEERRAVELGEAAAAERSRIARELHDIVAHAISVIVLQARGARRAEADSGASRRALDAIETTATRALAEMRRLVDVLGPDGEAVALSPQPGLADLEALLAEVRRAGLPVRLDVEGLPAELAPGVDLAAYRVIQEALTNTRRHAGASRAAVAIRYGDRQVEIEIVDDGSGGDGGGVGHGTVGMRERAALYGGSLEVGPRDGGGFGVVLRLPLMPDRVS